MQGEDLIRYRRAPHQAKLLMRAAEKIKASGLPPSAVEDRLLRAVLEDGAMEDNKDMQERWANLLANASTGATNVKAAFPTILAELDPLDAQLLDAVFVAFDQPSRSLRIDHTADASALGNLHRLGLVRSTFETKLNAGEVFIEPFGWEFVRACRDPQARGPVSP
ncbi:MAG: hypothetical protein WAU69_12280 [Solirubrobacteraceae bacterium]